MHSTIKDVASKANVSTATVSLVLHNHKRISQVTRSRVLKAVADLNYRPSRMARSLVLRETKNIGFLLTHDHFLRTEPFYTHIFIGTEFEARDHEYYVLLNTISGDFDKCNSLPRFILERNVDGVIIAGKSSVVTNVQAGKRYWGAPAIEMGDQKKAWTCFKKLPQMAKELKKLAKKVSKLEVAENDKK